MSSFTYVWSKEFQPKIMLTEKLDRPNRLQQALVNFKLVGTLKIKIINCTRFTINCVIERFCNVLWSHTRCHEVAAAEASKDGCLRVLLHYSLSLIAKPTRESSRLLLKHMSIKPEMLKKRRVCVVSDDVSIGIAPPACDVACHIVFFSHV